MSQVDWPQFWTDLKLLYEEEDGNSKSFELEFPVLENALQAIAEELKGSYTLGKPLGMLNPPTGADVTPLLELMCFSI